MRARVDAKGIGESRILHPVSVHGIRRSFVFLCYDYENSLGGNNSSGHVGAYDSHADGRVRAYARRARRGRCVEDGKGEGGE